MAAGAVDRIERFAGLVREVQTGDANKGLEGIDRSIGQLVENVIFRHNGHNRERAQEGRYDILSRFFEKRDTIDLERYPNVMHWFNTSAHHEGIDQSRHNRARPKLADPYLDHDDFTDSVYLDPDTNLEEDALTREQRGFFAQGLAHLPAPQAEAIAMAFWGGYTHSEISTLTGNPLGTTKGRLRLGLEKLGEFLVNGTNGCFDEEREFRSRHSEEPKPNSHTKEIDPFALKRQAALEINYFLGLSPDEIAEIVKEPRLRVANWIEGGISKKGGDRLPQALAKRRKLLQRPVTEIPVEHAVPIILRFMSEFSTSQTAQILGLNLQETRTAIQDGLSSLDQIKERILLRAQVQFQDNNSVRKNFFQAVAKQALSDEAVRDTLIRIVDDSESIAIAAKTLQVGKSTLERHLLDMGIRGKQAA